ncbi:MAG TPA: porin [Burkholderiales bacterium]|nr:porin [Burkholderiales bacterium]
MQRKLLAVAVAGALGAPAVALAQTSTVQIFGTMYVEYSWADQGRNATTAAPFTTGVDRSDADFIQTPGSEIGFKGEEKLGGGLSAWFQCTSTADPRGVSQEGWCSRNSALGLKGGFGNVFVGSWDTPFKRTISPSAVGGNDTGIWGTAFLLTGGSTTTSWPGAAAGSPASAGRGIFKRRQNSLITYDSPNFGGFQVMAAFTASQPSTGTLDPANNSHPRILSLGGQYRAGPLFVGAGYERHKDANGPTGVPVVAGTVREGSDDAWQIGAAYTWGPVRFGGQYTRQEIEIGTVAAPAEVKYRAWHFGVDWRIVGPHGLRAAYTRAQDSRQSGIAAGGANIVGSAGVTVFGASPTLPSGAAHIAGSGVNRPVALPGGSGDNGAKLWQIRYVYTFSKRTEFNFGYVRLDNDSVGVYNLGGLTGGYAAMRPGENQDAFAASLRHTF